MSPTLNENNVSEAESMIRTLFGRERIDKRELGGLSSGAIYQMHFTRQMREKLAKYEPFFQLSRGVAADIPRGIPLIVKLVWLPRPTKNTPDIARAVSKEIRREIRILSKLWSLRPITVLNKVYDIRKVVPKLYYAGFDGRMGVLIMEQLPGMTLTNVVRMKTSDDTRRWIIAKIEYALCCMYLNGYIHGDLHASNIQVDLDTKRVYLMDFGRTITMTPELVAEFKRSLVDRGSSALAKFWADKAEAYGNVAVLARRAKVPGVTKKWWSDLAVVTGLAAEPGMQGEGLQRLRRNVWVPFEEKKPEPRVSFRNTHPHRRRQSPPESPPRKKHRVSLPGFKDSKPVSFKK